MVDPLRHPDLEYIGRRLRDRLEETLEAEQAAARSATLRRRTLRDRLLEAEDRAEHLTLTTADGQFTAGVVRVVGADHVVIADGRRERFVALSHVVWIEAADGAG